MNLDTLKLALYLVDTAGNHFEVSADDFRLITDGCSCDYDFWDCGITRVEQYIYSKNGVRVGIMVATGLRKGV